MDARSWPALLYKGRVAGEDFDPMNVQDGLFEGFLVERVSFSYAFLDDQLVIPYSR